MPVHMQAGTNAVLRCREADVLLLHKISESPNLFSLKEKIKKTGPKA